MGLPVDIADREEVRPMFEGSWTQVKIEGSEDSRVVSSDELSDEGTESSGSHDPNGKLIQRPQETVEEFIRRIHGDDTKRVLTGYHESPALDLGASIGSVESHRGASLPEVPSDAGRDSAMGDSDKENHPPRSPRRIRAPRPTPYLRRVLRSRTIVSRSSSPEV